MAESQNRTLTEQFMLRLPDGMRDRIKAAAEANNRSMNAEIVARLDESLNREASALMIAGEKLNHVADMMERMLDAADRIERAAMAQAKSGDRHI